MSAKTSIPWVADESGNPGATWNPLRGTIGRHHCVRVSPGCKHCYAATMNRRFGGPDYVVGADTVRLDRDALLDPWRWRERRRVFPCSMTDLFGEWVDDEWLDAIFGVMGVAQGHTFLTLTKRVDRMADYLNAPGRVERVTLAAREIRASLPIPRRPPWPLDRGASLPWPLPNVWAGASVEDQPRADERMSDLVRSLARIRWVSVEPALGPVNLRPWLGLVRRDLAGQPDWAAARGEFSKPEAWGIHWVVYGGESGPLARPNNLAWARTLKHDCNALAVPFFFKQLGSRPVVALAGREDAVVPIRPRDRKGEDPAEFPPDLQVRQWPSWAATGR
jgi:protein gp37